MDPHPTTRTVRFAVICSSPRGKDHLYHFEGSTITRFRQTRGKGEQIHILSRCVVQDVSRQRLSRFQGSADGDQIHHLTVSLCLRV